MFLLFVLNTCWIIISELIYCLVTKNNNVFIERLTKRLAKTNILYVKVFQSLSLNNKNLDLNTNLLNFTDNVPYELADIDIDNLFNVCNEYNIHIVNNENPINSGMISLVFLGKKYSDNNNYIDIIIKMKRKNIDNNINLGIQNILTLIKLLKWIPFVEKYKITDVVQKNIDIIREQTNFNNEVKNIQLIKKNCVNLKYVKIPFVYEKITEKYENVIVMEYIKGCKISELKEEDYYGFSKQVLKFGLVTSLIHGVTHGDLHAGNILFMIDENDAKYRHKLGIIDFGILYRIKDTFRSTLFNIICNLNTMPINDLAEELLNSGIFVPKDIKNCLIKEHYNDILNFSTPILRETIHESNKANQIQLYKFISILFDYLNKNNLHIYGIKASDDFINLQLVLAMAHGVTLTLCKHNYMPVVNETIEELFHFNLLKS